MTRSRHSPQTTPSSSQRRHHVIVGCLHLLTGVIISGGISVLWVLLAQLGPLFAPTGLPILISLYWGPISIFLLVLGLLETIAAIALLLKQTWPRAVLLALSAILCLAVPVGTLLAGYTVWALALHRPEAQEG